LMSDISTADSNLITLLEVQYKCNHLRALKALRSNQRLNACISPSCLRQIYLQKVTILLDTRGVKSIYLCSYSNDQVVIFQGELSITHQVAFNI